MSFWKQLLPIRSRCRSGFTLIELLVAVSIIAILAALLLPVLGRTRYTARLTLCMANLRQTSMGLMLYAGNSDDWWPQRDVLDYPNAYVRPGVVRWLAVDERPRLQEYFSFRDLHCPLSPLGSTLPDTSNADYVWSPYHLYGGWRIDATLPASGMPKVDTAHHYSGRRFSVLAADLETRRCGWAGAWQVTLNHPDRSGMVAPLQRDDAIYCYSFWNRKGPSSGFDIRDETDRNFAFTDGSVVTYRRLVQEDPRLVRLPGLPKSTTEAFYFYLPPD